MIEEMSFIIEELDVLASRAAFSGFEVPERWEYLLRLEISLDQINPATASPGSPVTPALVDILLNLPAYDVHQIEQAIDRSNSLLTPEHIAEVYLIDIGTVLAKGQMGRDARDLYIERIKVERKKWTDRIVSLESIELNKGVTVLTHLNRIWLRKDSHRTIIKTHSTGKNKGNHHLVL